MIHTIGVKSMNCSNCDVSLTKNHICPNCGTDYSLYVQILELSNGYYNDGLMKARARDLSGAAEKLRISLQLNKRNVPARNLLGLIYYEMGDADLALKEWNVSRMLKFRSNPANKYVEELLSDTESVNSYNNSIRKFNLALQNVQEENNIDLAIVQLKKVININPRLLKAYQLLALLYIKTGQYAKALAVLNRCLEVDRGNICARAYINELKTRKLVQDKKERLTAGEKERADIVVPTKVRDVGTYVSNGLYILLGVVLALGIFWYAVVPEIRSEYESVSRYTASEYEGKIADLNREVTELNDEIDELNDTIEEMEKDSEEARADYEENTSNSEGIIADYNKLLDIFALYVNHDYINVETAFDELSLRDSEEAAYQDIYRQVRDNIQTEMPIQLLVWANYYRDSGDYQHAAEYYDQVLTYQQDANTLYWAGVSYQNLNNKDKAVSYYTMVAENHVETEFFEPAVEQIAALHGGNADTLKAQYRQQWQERQAAAQGDEQGGENGNP